MIAKYGKLFAFYLTKRENTTNNPNIANNLKTTTTNQQCGLHWGVVTKANMISLQHYVSVKRNLLKPLLDRWLSKLL